MEDQERETASTEAELKEDELELSLGLRPAPSIGQISHLSKPKSPVPEGSGDLSLSVPIWGKSGAGSDLDSEGLGFEMEAKKEAQALRRQEARKKRDGKRKSKASAFSGNSDSNADDFSKRRRLGDQRTIPEIPATTSFLGRPYYTMMPGLVQPATVGPGGFRPYLAAEKNPGDVKQSVSGCSRGSSPGVSDHRSTSGQGGSSSDGGSQSSHSHALIEPSETLKTATDSPNMKSSDIDKTPSVQPKTSSESSVVVNQSKPPKPPTQKSNESVLLSEMPYVSTTGNGPNGKTITGFLYKYTQSEVCIVCVCHGSFLTPAGFVEHAGGVDVHNPLRHITVVPFTVT